MRSQPPVWEVRSHAKTQLKLGNVTISEKSQTQGGKSAIYTELLDQGIHGGGGTTEPSRVGKGGDGLLVFNGYQAVVPDVKKSWKQ